MKKFLSINTLLIGLVLVAGVAGLLIKNLNQTSGATAIVDINYQGKEERMIIDLAKDDTYSIQAALPVTLVVKDGKISFQNSKCPDLLCEGFGEINIDGDFASCLPAGVIVVISEEN